MLMYFTFVRSIVHILSYLIVLCSNFELISVSGDVQLVEAVCVRVYII